MKINNSFAKLYAGSMIVANSLVSCVQKPFVKMPSENITKEFRKEMALYQKDAQKVLNDTTYILFGKDTLLYDSNFIQRIQEKAKKNVEKVIVDKKMITRVFFSGGRTHYIPEITYIKEDKYIDPIAIVRDTSVYTTDSVKTYIPVEFYGRVNPKAVPKH